MRFISKRALLESIEREHRTLVELASTIPRSRYREAGVWGDGWTVADLFAHLTAWEQMCLRWYREGRAGGTPEVPAPGYAWRETPALNRAIQREHGRRSVTRVLKEFDASYREILAFARSLPPRALFTPGHCGWTRTPFVTYLGANTVSHYRTATKILKRWLKGERRPRR